MESLDAVVDVITLCNLETAAIALPLMFTPDVLLLPPTALEVSSFVVVMPVSFSLADYYLCSL
jgi:hypothetical protein